MTVIETALEGNEDIRNLLIVARITRPDVILLYTEEAFVAHVMGSAANNGLRIEDLMFLHEPLHTFYKRVESMAWLAQKERVAEVYAELAPYKKQKTEINQTLPFSTPVPVNLPDCPVNTRSRVSQQERKNCVYEQQRQRHS